MSTIDQRLKNILINLNIIGRIEENQYPVFKNGNVFIRTYIPVYTSLIRKMAGETRKDILDGLQLLISDINKLIHDYNSIIFIESNRYDKTQIENTILSLGRLKTNIENIYINETTGLNGLKKTYSQDHEVQGQLDELTNNFKLVFRELSIKCDELISQTSQTI